MYQVLLKSDGVRPFFVITWPGITHKPVHIILSLLLISDVQRHGDLNKCSYL